MALEIVPFTADLIADAAALLAARHQRDRAVFPELPAQFENRDAACTAFRWPGSFRSTCGGAALENGRLVGFLRRHELQRAAGVGGFARQGTRWQPVCPLNCMPICTPSSGRAGWNGAASITLP
jgi:hypothetical protein